MQIVRKIVEKSRSGDGVRTPVIAVFGDSVMEGCFELYMKSEALLGNVCEPEFSYGFCLKRMLSIFFPSVTVELVNADFAGYPLKEAVVCHLQEKGWTVTDIGVQADSDPEDTDLMFHRVGLRAGAMISEGEFERALLFCGTGMGIHIAASKCPHVHAGVVESVPAARHAVTGNGVNVLTMGAFYVAPSMGCDIADAYLSAELGTDYEWWENFYEFHKLSIDELEAFDYDTYKKNGFKVKKLGDYPLKLEKKPE